MNAQSKGTGGELREALLECERAIRDAVPFIGWTGSYPDLVKACEDAANKACRALQSPPPAQGANAMGEALSRLGGIVNEGRGNVEIGLTEDGNFGVWLHPGNDKAAGTGNTVEEAIVTAMARPTPAPQPSREP